MPAKRRRSRKKTRRSRKDPAARERALEVLHLMRSEGQSLTQAARVAQTTPKTVRKYAGRALIRSASGRYAATPSDRLTRHVWFFTSTRKVEIAVRGSRQASRVARYMAAVDRYLKKGDVDALAEFEGRGIRSGNKTYPFLTDTEALHEIAYAGEMKFEDLYSRRA